MRILRALLNRIPFQLLVPFFYLVYILSILLDAVLSPLIYLYGLPLCSKVWMEWEKQGKDVLVVEVDGEHSQPWLSRIIPLVGHRVVLLDDSQQERWDRWSLPVQLFALFGPHGIPERFTAHSLPAVILFRQFRLPERFTFGERSKNREGTLERLRTALG